MYCLNEENGGHSSETKSAVKRAECGGSALLLVTTVGTAAVGSLGTGAVEVGLAGELALDQLLVLESLVRRARGGDVITRLDVERTLDLLKLGS